MLMTVLEAHLSSDKWAALENAFNQAVQQISPPVMHTYLLHGSTDTALWQIVTIWRSRKELEEMQRLGTPKGVVIFQAAGAKPKLTVFDLVAEGKASS